MVHEYAGTTSQLQVRILGSVQESGIRALDVNGRFDFPEFLD